MGKLAKWFRIESEEKPLIFLLSAGTFFLTAANTLLFNLLQAFLIKRAGVGYLPYFYVGSSLAIFIGSWVTLVPLRAWKPARQGAAYAVFALAGASLLAATQHLFSAGSGIVTTFIFVLFGLLVNSAAIIGVVDKLTVITNDTFNSEQQLRLTPLLTSVSTLSALIAGLFQAVLTERVGIGWSFFLAAMALAPVVWLVFRLRPLARSVAAVEASGGGRKSGRGLARDFPDRRSRNFIYVVGGVAALSMVFTRIFNFQLAEAANSRFPTEVALNSFYGWLTVVLSVGTLIFVNLGQRRLLQRYGLIRNLFLVPLLVMAGAAAMMISPTFAVVVGVVALREVILPLQIFAVHGVLGGLSDHQRKQAWSWLEGPVTTVGSLAGSGLLIAATFLFRGYGSADTIRLLSAAAFMFLLVRLYLTYRMGRDLPAVLLQSLRHGDFKTRLRSMESLAELRYLPDRHLGATLDIVKDESEPTTLRLTALRTLAAIKDPSSLRVVSRLLGHPDRDLRLEAVHTVAAFRYQPDRLYESGFSRHVLIERLRFVFAREQSPEVTSAVLDALVALRDPDIVSLISATLQGPSAEMRHSALRSLRRFNDPAIIDYVTPFLTQPDPDLKAQAIAAIWRFPWERRGALGQAIDDLLGSAPDSEERRQGLYLIGVLRLGGRRRVLLDALDSGSLRLRLTAAVALLKLGDESGSAVLDEALQSGSAAEAREVERLVGHHNVPERQQERIRAMVHNHHLHYPEELPVSEPLRARLCAIPRPCLEALGRHYQAPGDLEESRKIGLAASLKDLPEPRGRVLLAGLAGPWAEMAEIALLAGGYLVRTAESASPGAIETGEMVVGRTGAAGLPRDAIILSERSEGLGENEVAARHYAPSELLEAIRRAGA